MIDPETAQVIARSVQATSDPTMGYVGGTLGTVGGGIVLWYLRAIYETMAKLTDSYSQFIINFNSHAQQENRTLDHLSMSIQNHAETTGRLERAIERLTLK